MKLVQQRNALNVIYSSPSVRNYSTTVTPFLPNPVTSSTPCVPRATIQHDGQSRSPYLDNCNQHDIPPSPLFEPIHRDAYINGGRWPVTYQTCVSIRITPTKNTILYGYRRFRWIFRLSWHRFVDDIFRLLLSHVTDYQWSVTQDY